MVLESTMICCDNSDFQRNGDYLPSRMAVQKDAINMICLSKIRANPENDIGLLTMAQPVQVLSSLTTQIGHVYGKLNAVEANGELNVITALRIAQLALKHRQGEYHKMRMVIFIGSPLNLNIWVDLINLAKRFRKEKVYVDIIHFGGYKNNEQLLKDFIDVLNGKDGKDSHYLNVERGAMISDVLLQSPIMADENNVTGLMTAQRNGLDADIDDPDLALALLLSLQEEERRLQDIEREHGLVEVRETVNDTEIPDFDNMSIEEQIAYIIRISAAEISDSDTSDDLSTASAAADAENNTNTDRSETSTKKRKRENTDQDQN